MFKHLNSIVFQSITFFTIVSCILCLNITEMSVTSIVEAPNETTLTCIKQDDIENDTFEYILWHKLVENQWKLIKKYPKDVSEPETTEPQTEQPNPETTTETSNSVSQTAVKPKLEFYKLEEMTESDDSNIQLSKTSLSSAGQYKCSLKSTGSPKMSEMIKELRIVYKPIDGSKPELSLIRSQDNHITVQCSAPASHPITALQFFINYEPASREDVHRINTIRTKNTSHGETEELLINVEELRFRATKDTVLNGNIGIVCAATFAQLSHDSVGIDIPFEGTLYDPKCLSPAIIILIVIVVIVVVAIVAAIVWVYLRKKKLNSMNKVAELFNKGKSITVLVDNNPNEPKVD